MVIRHSEVHVPKYQCLQHQSLTMMILTIKSQITNIQKNLQMEIIYQQQLKKILIEMFQIIYQQFQDWRNYTKYYFKINKKYKPSLEQRILRYLTHKNINSIIELQSKLILQYHPQINNILKSISIFNKLILDINSQELMNHQINFTLKYKLHQINLTLGIKLVTIKVFNQQKKLLGLVQINQDQIQTLSKGMFSNVKQIYYHIMASSRSNNLFELIPSDLIIHFYSTNSKEIQQNWELRIPFNNVIQQKILNKQLIKEYFTLQQLFNKLQAIQIEKIQQVQRLNDVQQNQMSQIISLLTKMHINPNQILQKFSIQQLGKNPNMIFQYLNKEHQISLSQSNGFNENQEGDNQILNRTSQNKSKQFQLMKSDSILLEKSELSYKIQNQQQFSQCIDILNEQIKGQIEMSDQGNQESNLLQTSITQSKIIQKNIHFFNIQNLVNLWIQPKLSNKNSSLQNSSLLNQSIVFPQSCNKKIYQWIQFQQINVDQEKKNNQNKLTSSESLIIQGRQLEFKQIIQWIQPKDYNLNQSTKTINKDKNIKINQQIKKTKQNKKIENYQNNYNHTNNQNNQNNSNLYKFKQSTNQTNFISFFNANKLSFRENSFRLLEGNILEKIGRTKYDQVIGIQPISQNKQSIFGVRVVESVYGQIMLGLVSQQGSKFHSSCLSRQSIYYNGWNGSIWSEAKFVFQGLKLNIGEVIMVRVDKKKRLISWQFNEKNKITIEIGSYLIKKKLYPKFQVSYFGDKVELF